MKEIVIGSILGALIALFLVLASAEAHGQENCPLDWHPPPCGPAPKIDSHKKEAAKAASRYFDEAFDFLGAWAAATCSATRMGDPRIDAAAKLGCGAATVAAFAANRAKAWADRIVAADPYDPLFQYPYDGRWLSYDELGLMEILAYSDNPYIWNIAEHIQAIDMIGDFVVVSIDRSYSCYSDQEGISHLCYIWQWERVEAGIVWFGQRFEALAANISYLADELEPDIGQGVNPDFVYLLDEFAAWTDWAGRELQ